MEPVPIPDCLKHRPTYRGLAIPFVVTMEGDKPNFKLQSRIKQIEAGQKNLCHICGRKMELLFVFIGSELAFEHNTFLEGPMHSGCAYYAAAACPFLARKDYKFSEIPNPKSPQACEHNLTVAGKPKQGRYGIGMTDSYRTNHFGIQYPEFIPGTWLAIDWETIPAGEPFEKAYRDVPTNSTIS